MWCVGVEYITIQWGLCIGPVYQLLHKDSLIIEDKGVQHKDIVHCMYTVGGGAVY